jgi:methionine-rich copper-binding protein CopC
MKEWTIKTAEKPRSWRRGSLPRRRRSRTTLLACCIGAALVTWLVPSIAVAGGTVGTATLTQGSVSYAAPATVAFAVRLNGSDQVAAASQSINVIDGTGSSSGWNVTLTSTTFVAGHHRLPNNSAFDAGSTGRCDAGATCTLANTSATNYPVVIPSAAKAPIAVRILSANVHSGMGGQTWVQAMRLTVHANAHGGAYTATWTYSLVSAP